MLNRSGLVLGYRAPKDTATDTATNHFGTIHGVLTNGATRASDGGAAYSFDGANDYIDGGNLCNFDRAQSFSVGFWLRPSAAIASFQFFIGRQSSENLRGWRISSGPDIGRQQVLFQLISDSTLNGISVRTLDNINSSSIWRHVGVSYSGNSSASGMRIYVNGVQVTTPIVQNNLTATTLSSADFSVGLRKADSGGPYSGLMDDIVIGSRVFSDNEFAFLASYRGAGHELLAASNRGFPLSRLVN